MKKIIILFIVGLVIVRCNSVSAINPARQSTRIGEETMQSNESNIIEFKINGQPVKTSGWNISRFHFGDNPVEWLNITTNMHDEQRTINVNLGGAVPGEYIIDESDPTKPSHGSFFPDYIGDIGNSYSFTKGVFTITRLDTAGRVINATFAGTVRSQHGEILEITDGRILNGRLKPG